MTLAGLVQQTYPSPEWAVFFEVGDGTGFNTKRHADAVALGVWESRGYTLVGFEFKEYRNDWLREKKNPEKAEAVAAHCDSWYVVAGSADVVKVEELPEPWGLYVANADRTKLLNKKTCVPFPGRDKSVMQRRFAAAMLRKVGETTVPKSELARMVEEQVKAAVDRTSAGHDLRVLRDEVARYKAMVDGFKAKAGVDLNHWHGHEKISAAVGLILRGDEHRRRFAHIGDELTKMAKDAKQALAAWPELSAPSETL